MNVSEVMVERLAGKGPKQFSVLIYGAILDGMRNSRVQSSVAKAVSRLGLDPKQYRAVYWSRLHSPEVTW